MGDQPGTLTTDDLPPKLQDVVAKEIDEARLVWLDQPDPNSFAKRMWKHQCMGGVGIAFACYWYNMTAGMIEGAGDPSPADRLFPFAALIPAGIGVGMLMSPLLARRTARTIAYAITDRHAILFRWYLGSPMITRYLPDDLRDVEMRPREDGTGDLIFERYQSHSGAKAGRPAREIGFLGVENVREVRRLLDALIDSSAVASSETG